MKALTVILAFIWFLGWGFWFLYERGHIQFSTVITGNPRLEQKVDSIAILQKPEIKTSFLLGGHPHADSIDIVIDSLMSDRNPRESIQVISYYAEEENYSGNNGNLGIQRSINLIHNAQKKYAGRILQPMGLKLKGDVDTTGVSSYFDVEKIDKRAPIRILNHNRVLVFFPFASDNEGASSKISGPLDSLCNIWNQEKNRLIITGYTDNSANETINYNLGLERAKSIQETMVENGFPENRITTLSRGEKDPISTNTTFDGRYLNRRVEILVDK